MSVVRRCLLALALLLALPVGATPPAAPVRTVRVVLDPGQHRALATASTSRQASLAHGYAALIGEATGVRFSERQVDTHASALQAVCEQQADLMLMLGPLHEAPCALAASPAYYSGEALLAVRHARRTQVVLDAQAAHRVAVVQGSRYAGWLRRHYPHLQIVPAPDLPAALNAVDAGIADAALGLDVLIRPLVRRRHADSLVLLSAPSDVPGDVFLVTRQADAALLQGIDAAMNTITPMQHANVLRDVASHRPFDPPSPAMLMRHLRWELLGVVALVTALLAAGAWLLFARRAAQRNERQQARFIGVMSHEVRNAAQALVAAVDLLGNSRLDQGQRQLVDAARTAGTGLRQLLGHALDYSRMAAGRFQPTLDWYDITALAQDCIAALRPAAEAKGLALCLHVAADPLPRVRTDAAALRQILNNLLGNALKFTAHGHIDVALSLRLAADGHQLCLSVCDTGIGIPTERQAAVFRPFAQAHDAQSQALGGAGLGLSICRDMVHALRGRIQLASTPGEGSRFDVTLPVACEARPAGQDNAPLAGYRALVVEDHAVNRAFVAHRLCALGASVDACQDAASALRLQAATPATLVLIDCALPDLSGYQLAHALRRLERAHSHPPALLVALSAATSAAHVQRCQASGMDAVLCKPLDERHLLAVLGLGASAEAGAARVLSSSDPLWQPLLASLAEDLAAMQQALGCCEAAPLQHHAHRISGALHLMGQTELAGTAHDLCDLDLAEPAGWDDARRLLAHLQQAVAPLAARVT
ncbi:ATP-binding protein [Stenotrophomonas sp.]|uniref:ATP-binding protein n=1 Tax=Stenotrophomonas sp. TaxID=69392 RepID=UPI002FC618D3